MTALRFLKSDKDDEQSLCGSEDRLGPKGLPEKGLRTKAGWFPY